MAKIIRLAEFTEKAWAPRWHALQKQLKDECAIDLQFEIIEVTEDNRKEKLDGILARDFDVVRVSDGLSGLIESLLPQTTYEVSLFHAAGLILRKQNKWWPDSFFDEPFRRTVAEQIGLLDLAGSALVIGARGSAKLIAGTFVTMGFQSISISDQDQDAAKVAVAALSEHQFGAKFSVVPSTAITTLTGSYTVVVNTTPLDPENELLEELYFFNFLRPKGTVIDLTLVPAKTPLLVEAEQWGARLVDGATIAADRDAYMIELLTGQKLSLNNYRKAFRAAIDAVPFDPSPFLKKFRDRES